MNDMSKNSFFWHISCVSLLLLFGKITEKYSPDEYPVTAFGNRAFVWGDESPINIFNLAIINKAWGWLDESEICFLDYLPNQKTDKNYFYNKKLANFFIKLAAGKVENPNEYEKEFIADLIKNGYAVNNNGEISVTMPVYTQPQKNKLFALILPMADELFVFAAEIKQAVKQILKNHVPPHLKKQIDGIACMRMFDEVIGKSVEAMRRKDYLKASWNANEIPTVYVILD